MIDLPRERHIHCWTVSGDNRWARTAGGITYMRFVAYCTCGMFVDRDGRIRSTIRVRTITQKRVKRKFKS